MRAPASSSRGTQASVTRGQATAEAPCSACCQSLLGPLPLVKGYTRVTETTPKGPRVPEPGSRISSVPCSELSPLPLRPETSEKWCPFGSLHAATFQHFCITQGVSRFFLGSPWGKSALSPFASPSLLLSLFPPLLSLLNFLFLFLSFCPG